MTIHMIFEEIPIDYVSYLLKMLSSALDLTLWKVKET